MTLSSSPTLNKPTKQQSSVNKHTNMNMNTLRKRYEQALSAHNLTQTYRVIKTLAKIEPGLTKFAFQLRKARHWIANPAPLATPQR